MEQKQIKVLIKKPEDMYGRMTYVNNHLAELQRIVGGFIEVVQYRDLTIICNDEGKLRKLEPNILLGQDLLVGTIIVCGTEEDYFSDIPCDFDRWKRIVDMSGTDTWKEFMDDMKIDVQMLQNERGR